ncbi:MAG TPA: PQQ-binding-like beta-propeller repeat protein [Verrucomicrobiae bacterium]|nr:PQQ-binding-like beta-propeller repeat protein [Verrucomicrobiae bacterium]
MATGITRANVAKLRLHWVFDSGAPFYSGPIVANGVLYTMNAVGELSALDAASGRRLWHRRFDRNAMTPAYHDGTLFVSTRDAVHNHPSVFYALDPATGATRWQVSIPGGTHSSPVFANGFVYVAVALGDAPFCDAGGVHLFDERTGAPGPVWLTSAQDQPDGGGVWGALSLTPDGESLLYGTGNTCHNSPATANAIVAITPYATLRWADNTADPLADDDVAGGVMVLGNDGYVIGKNGVFYHVDVRSGTILWSLSLGAPVGFGGFATPSYTESTLIVSGGFSRLAGAAPTGGMLYGLTTAGARKWEIRTKVPAEGGWIATTEDLAFTMLDNSVDALDPSTGKILWSYTTQGYPNSQTGAIVTPEGVFADDIKGYLYAFTIPKPGDAAPDTHELGPVRRGMPAQNDELPNLPKHCAL